MHRITPSKNIDIDMIFEYYPKWALKVLKPGQKFPSEREVMSATIELGKYNVANGGGPFAATVISSCCEVVAMGFNRVIDSCDPTAHAEYRLVTLHGQLAHIGFHRISRWYRPANPALCVVAPSTYRE